jgi:hypothetical protein
VSARRWLPAAGVTLVAAGFSWLNRGERVPLDLGLFRVYRAPLTIVTFLAFLAGMLSMLLLGLRHDRRVRDELRRRGLLEVPPTAPARPVASAWGVAREPADPREDDGRTAARAGDDDRTIVHAREDDRTVAYPRYDEDPAA